MAGGLPVTLLVPGLLVTGLFVVLLVVPGLKNPPSLRSISDHDTIPLSLRFMLS